MNLEGVFYCMVNFDNFMSWAILHDLLRMPLVHVGVPYSEFSVFYRSIQPYLPRLSPVVNVRHALGKNTL